MHSGVNLHHLLGMWLGFGKTNSVYRIIMGDVYLHGQKEYTTKTYET
jgi:hypothetical protein